MPMPRYLWKKFWILPVILTVAMSGCSSNSDDKDQETGAVRKKITMTPKPAESESAVPAPAPAPEAGGLIEPPMESGGRAASSPPIPEGKVVPETPALPAKVDEKTVLEDGGALTGQARAGDEVSPKVAYMIDNKIDPFIPLFKDEAQQTVPGPGSVEEKAAGRRIPQGPLETMELEQLKLTGIVSTQRIKKALVEEASGKGYVIEIGTYIGRNGGRVTQIFDDRVIVQEENTDALGKKNVRERELKLQHGEGGTPHE